MTTFRSWLPFCVCMVLVAGGASNAEAGEDKPGKEKPKDVAVDVYFAQQLSVALGKELAADKLVDGVPLALVELIKTRYPQPNSQGPLLKEYQGCAKEFEARWKSYDERRTVVNKALKKSEGLKAAKKPAEALDAAQEAVTAHAPPPVDHLGRPKPVKRDFLEVRDAELPAVTALAALAVSQQEIERLPQVRADFLARRRVSSSEMTERLGWLANHCGKGVRGSQKRFYGFSMGQKGEATKAMEKVLNYVGRSASDGKSLSTGFFQTMPEHGVQFVEIGSQVKAKKGTWVLLAFEPTKVKKKKISYKKKDVWKESFNCKPTDQITGIDPVTGRFLYKWKCEERTKKSTVTLTAALTKKIKMKKNAKGKYDKVWVLGQLKKPGPKWSLNKARVIELPEGTNLKFLTPGFRK